MNSIIFVIGLDESKGITGLTEVGEYWFEHSQAGCGRNLFWAPRPSKWCRRWGQQWRQTRSSVLKKLYIWGLRHPFMRYIALLY